VSWQDRERRGRNRERIALSVLSLLVVFLLLGGFFYLRASQEPVGKLSVVSTSQVTISVNEAPPPQVQEPAPAPEPTATSTAQRAAGRGPGIVSEVLSGGQAEAAAANRPNLSTGGAQASATAVATATSAVRSGISLGGSGGGTNSGGTSGGGGGPLGRVFEPPDPTNTPPPGTPRPASTFEAGGATPAGHNSHLHIDGVVGPGAYTTGGIIVSNVGPVAFNYSLSMSTAGGAEFAAALRLRIYLRVGASCDYRGPPPSPAADLLPLTGDQVGTVLYDGNFGSGNKFGDPSVELAAGDRPLGIGQSEVLCMEVFFPWTAGNESQGQTVNGSLIFTAKSPE